jgi:hypothetical protein
MPINPHGIVTTRIIRDGTIIAEETKENVTCTAGVVLLVNLATGVGSFTPVQGTLFQWIGIGSGTSPAPNATDTALISTVQVLPYTSFNAGTTTVSGDTAQMTVSFPFVFSGATINEAGLFSGTATNLGGILLGHVAVGPSTVHVGDIFQVTWAEVF